MLEKSFRETYTWTAFYDDSTVLDQYNSDGTKNQYPDIDRTKLAAFGIYQNVADSRAEYETKDLIYRVFLEPTQKLIYRRRPTGSWYTGVINSETILIGTSQKVKGVDVQNIAYIDVASGIIQHAGKWVGGAPTLLGIEK